MLEVLSRFSRKEQVKIVSCGIILGVLFFAFLVAAILYAIGVNTFCPVRHIYYIQRID